MKHHYRTNNINTTRSLNERNLLLSKPNTLMVKMFYACRKIQIYSNIVLNGKKLIDHNLKLNI